VTVKWREEALVLIALVCMLVYVPVLLNDVSPRRDEIIWFTVGWIAARASALWVARRRRETRDGR
jgi:hypothetical protein